MIHAVKFFISLLIRHRHTIFYHFMPLFFISFPVAFCFLSFPYHVFDVGFSLWSFIAAWLLIGLVGLWLRYAIPFFIVFFYSFKVAEHDAEILDLKGAITYDGEPGNGKTLLMTYDGVTKAAAAWTSVQLDYFLGLALRKDKATIFSDDEQRIFNSLESTVNFYKKNTSFIPLLVSNYGIRCGCQMSAHLDKAHYLQAERLPEGCIWLQDESADLFSNVRSGAKPSAKDPIKNAIYEENQRIADTVSKLRHYGDWVMSYAEQDSGENQKDLRRVVTTNKHLEKLTRVCEPRFLLWLLDYFCDKVLKKGEKTSLFLARFVFKLRSIIKQIGFFKIQFVDYGNDVKGLGVKSKGFIALPKRLPFSYESRAYRFDYLALGKPLALKVHSSLFSTSR